MIEGDPEPEQSELVVRISKIVKEEDGTFKTTFEIDALKEIFTHPEIAEDLVVIYAFTGPFRGGKSFYLNLIMRYYKRSKMQENELPSPEEEKLETCFEWSGGVDPHTKGAYILKEPLRVDIDTETHQKAAVFFMDVQGDMDVHSSLKNASQIGRNVFIISSRIFFNVKDMLAQNHLDLLYRNMKLSSDLKNKFVKKSEGEEGWKIFKHPLLTILIRDWMHGTTYGFEGGNTYFKRFLGQDVENSDNRAKEHILMRNYLLSNIDTIDCFLCHEPTNEVRRGELPQECLIKDIGEAFLNGVDELFKHRFSNVRGDVKSINGQEVTCLELYETLAIYAPFLNGQLKENAESIIEADYKAEMNLVKHACRKVYIKEITDKIPNVRKAAKDNKLEETEDFRTVLDAVMTKFDEMQKPNDADYVAKWRTKIERLFICCNNGMKICFEAERKYESRMEEFTAYLESVTPKLLFRSDKLKTKVEHCLDRLIESMKVEIHQSIKEECCHYFKSEGEGHLERIDKKLSNRSKGAAKVFGVTVLAAATVGMFALIPTAIVGGIAGGVAAIVHVNNGIKKIKNLDQIATTLNPEGHKRLTDNECDNFLLDNAKLKVRLSFGFVTYCLNTK